MHVIDMIAMILGYWFIYAAGLGFCIVIAKWLIGRTEDTPETSVSTSVGPASTTGRPMRIDAATLQGGADATAGGVG